MRGRVDIDRFHGYDVNIATRTLWLSGDSDQDNLISPVTAEKFIKNIHLLECVNKDEITILVNSQGGDVESGFAIYDAIETSCCFITTKVFRAESMASMIIQAADNRILMPNCKIMIHHGSIGISETHVKTVYKHIEESKKDDRKYSSILLKKIKEKKPKFTHAQLKEMLEHDTYLSATQAIQLGLADSIYGQ